jgi:hypothetical protein
MGKSGSIAGYSRILWFLLDNKHIDYVNKVVDIYEDLCIEWAESYSQYCEDQ